MGIYGIYCTYTSIVIKYMSIRNNTKEEDLELAKKLLKEYEAKGDKKNIEICLRNIKNFSK